MKTIKIILLALAMFACGAYAQNEQHLTFMGIPIDGPLATFEKSLLAKGFVFDENGYNTSTARYYKGCLFGQDIDLSIGTTPLSQNVWSVGAYFENIKDEQTGDELFEKIDSDIKAKYKVRKTKVKTLKFKKKISHLFKYYYLREFGIRYCL